MEISLDLVCVINMNFDTDCVNYSRKSQLCDATVGVNRAQQQPGQRTNKSLRTSKQSSRTYNLETYFSDHNYKAVCALINW